MTSCLVTATSGCRKQPQHRPLLEEQDTVLSPWLDGKTSPARAEVFISVTVLPWAQRPCKTVCQEFTGFLDVEGVLPRRQRVLPCIRGFAFPHARALFAWQYIC